MSSGLIVRLRAGSGLLGTVEKRHRTARQGGRVMSPIPRGSHLGVLAKTRARHHSGPVRGVVPGTARIRETTALGGAEPIAGTVRTPVRPGGHLGSGVCGKESGRCPGFNNTAGISEY